MSDLSDSKPILLKVEHRLGMDFIVESSVPARGLFWATYAGMAKAAAREGRRVDVVFPMPPEHPQDAAVAAGIVFG